jgi:hypothetical protein
MNWRTTVFGTLAAIGGTICGAFKMYPELFTNWPHWIPGAALIMSGLGGTLFAYHAADAKAVDQGAQPVPVKNLGLLLLLGGSLGLAGCVTEHTTHFDLAPNGTTNGVTVTSAPFYKTHIMLHSARFLGVKLRQDSQTQIPYFVLGWGSDVEQLIPTAVGTNINSPRVMNALKIQNSLNPLSTGIEENSGAGEVYIGGTTDTSKAIIPSAYTPPVHTNAAPAQPAAATPKPAPIPPAAPGQAQIIPGVLTNQFLQIPLSQTTAAESARLAELLHHYNPTNQSPKL